MITAEAVEAAVGVLRGPVTVAFSDEELVRQMLEAAAPYMQVERRVPPLTEAEWDALRQLPNPCRE